MPTTALRRRLRAIETDLQSVAEHNGRSTADMEFMLDATVGLIDIQQNKVIYILSIVGVVLTPPVLVASIYGMNFHHMPELDWPYGYAWALGLMLVSAVGPYLIFKLRGGLAVTLRTRRPVPPDRPARPGRPPPTRPSAARP